MAKLQFKKAAKSQSKLRLALFGVSGSGKTYSALRIATGMGGDIALIDTERGSAAKYADRFEFDVLELPDYRLETYRQAINLACGQYDVLIIDSLSHAWRKLLEEIDKLAQSKYKGNTWAAWSEGTPAQRKFVDCLLQCNSHVIATMRSKTEWDLTKDDRGRAKPIRVGLRPDQGKGIEYEFDMLMQLSPEHIAHVLKDRTSKWQDELIEKPDEDFGAALAEWLQEGTKQTEQREPEPKQATSENNGQEGKDGEGQNGKDKPQARPYPPETLRKGLQQRIKKHGSDELAPQSKRGAVCGALEDLFADADEDIKRAKRYSLLKYLVGKDTSKTLTDAEARALLYWASDKVEDDGGEIWVPDSNAVQEAAKIIEAVDVAAGQESLEI